MRRARKRRPVGGTGKRKAAGTVESCEYASRAGRWETRGRLFEKAPEIRFVGLQVQDLLVAELAVVEVARSRHGIARAAVCPDVKSRLARACMRKLRRIARAGGHFPARQAGAGAFGARAVRGKRGLPPFADDAASRAGDDLPGAVADEAHDLRARSGIEAARGKNLRDLLAELAVALERLFDILPDGPRRAGRAGARCLGVPLRLPRPSPNSAA